VPNHGNHQTVEGLARVRFAHHALNLFEKPHRYTVPRQRSIGGAAIGQQYSITDPGFAEDTVRLGALVTKSMAVSGVAAAVLAGFVRGMAAKPRGW